MTLQRNSRQFLSPAKIWPGDKVAILSPSSGLPERYSAIYEQGLQRLREHFALEPVESSTTRQLHALSRIGGRDIHGAFADPQIKAIISSTGGGGQIRMLKYLDPELLKGHPKWGYLHKRTGSPQSTESQIIHHHELFQLDAHEARARALDHRFPVG